MMGRSTRQMHLVMVDLSDLIKDTHLLKKIDKHINFDFIYEKAKPYYAERGRKSIDPVVMIKMLLIGYLYGIKSERRLEEEVSLNLAYRWFCGIELDEKIPDHSTFSQNRKRRFQDDAIFREIFNEIVINCIKKGIVSGETLVSDGSFIPANVAWTSKEELIVTVERSAVSYLDILDEELSKLPGYQKPECITEEKKLVKSSTDKDCGYINHQTKKGLGYLTEMTVDTKNGIITGVDTYPANHRESNIILRHLDRQMKDTGIQIKEIALDGGYDVGAVHRGLELLGINGYCSPREYHNNALKKGFEYDPDQDVFICAHGKKLSFERIVYKKPSSNYYRVYSLPRQECKCCNFRQHCSVDNGKCRITASSFYPSFFANQKRSASTRYKDLKRLRSIWSEGTFSVLKREHKLGKAVKRGLCRIGEECLLAAMALNLKRIVTAL